MAERGKNKEQAREIARLLRFIGNHGCIMEDQAGEYLLLRPGGAGQPARREAVERASRAGLVLVREGRIFATREARNWLRRYRSAREEAFLDQHRVIEIAEATIDGERIHVRINAAESPLALMARLKDKSGNAWFPPDAMLAGERLARDFHFAALQPKLTQSYEPRPGASGRPGPGAGAELKDNVVAARTRVARAVDAMGPDLAGVVLDVCCFEKGLEVVERERQWPARSAKLMLKTALMQLHRHYNPPSREPARRSHAWGAEGYRPAMP
ncbi:MAG: ATPase involved in replication initiation [Rhizobium sp.]|nr:ATPase involved in replication initiation [Rhizobium sp.]